MKRRHVVSSNFFLGMLFAIAMMPINSTLAAPPEYLATPSLTGEHQGITINADGSVQLSPPMAMPQATQTAEQGFHRYGFILSPVQPFDSLSSRFNVSYRSLVPNGSSLQIDLRGSVDGKRWTEWQTALVSKQTVDFAYPVRMVQYRAVLKGTKSVSPIVYSVQVQKVSGAEYHIFTEDSQENTAPTYKIFATRQGMVGSRTANGYIIEPNAWFVALPSWRALCSPGGQEYQVRITYNGKSVVAPVWDVGPWNTRDDFWSVQREQYSDLRRGWPQDHAAYFDGYNGGYAEKGFVSAPTAIDIGDGAWWALGLPDGRFEVEVTFLWVGSDPVSETLSQTDPNASEFVIDESRYPGSNFHAESKVTWYHSPRGCGSGNHALWTLTTTDPNQQENKAFWQPKLSHDGLYDVYVHVPICPNKYPITQSAHYLVQYQGGAQNIVVNQAEQTGWVLLGQFPFAARNSGFVHLTDLTSEEMHAIWFDDVKWVPVK